MLIQNGPDRTRSNESDVAESSWTKLCLNLAPNLNINLSWFHESCSESCHKTRENSSYISCHHFGRHSKSTRTVQTEVPTATTSIMATTPMIKPGISLTGNANDADGGGEVVAPAKKSYARIFVIFLLIMAGILAVTIISISLSGRSEESKNISPSSQNVLEDQGAPVLDLSSNPSGSPSPSTALSDSPTIEPTVSRFPTAEPSSTPSLQPSVSPSSQPSRPPSDAPTYTPSTTPTAMPTISPSAVPTFAPSSTPTDMPTVPVPVSYVPGELSKQEGHLLLSTGLTSRIIARTNQRVQYDNGGRSEIRFHSWPDMGATFPDDRPFNKGGFIYVSNSEEDPGMGGVGALTFDKDFNVIDYRWLLSDTVWNCGGGRTPWGSWISCEESPGGRAWQVDPTGERPPRYITLGSDGGQFESFAYDVRDLDNAHFYITEDHSRGPVQRFTPHDPNWQDPWNILHGSGDIHYLLLIPESNTGGRYRWTTNKVLASQNANQYYPNCEGIDISGNQMFVVSKVLKRLFTFDLDGDTYTATSTLSGLFNSQPDQIAYILGSHDLLYFTEDGARNTGIHARNALGQYFTILESPTLNSETTGLSFSPDHKRMYVAYQQDGILYEIRREDGYPFNELSLNVKYHSLNLGVTRRM